jgi:hypothetical protein
MPMHEGKYVSGHLKAHPANKPGKEMPKAKQPDKGMPASQKHGAEPKTEAHPSTGVHSVHAFHVGGGKYVTHTHHGDGGQPMEDHHENASMMHAHMAQHMPDEEHNETQPDDETGEAITGDLAGLGGGMDDQA